MDNFNTSPLLLQELFRCGTLACGTFNLNRRGIPDSFRAPFQVAEFVQHSNLSVFVRKVIVIYHFKNGFYSAFSGNSNQSHYFNFYQ